MKNLAVKLWNWLVTYSENPEQWSMRIKGIGIFLSGTIAFSLTHLGLPTEQVQVITYLAYLTQSGGIIYTIAGVIRYLGNIVDKKVPPTV